MNPGLQPSVTLRDRLLREESWLDGRDVAKHVQNANLHGDPSQVASRLRVEREIIGARIRGAYLYPEFQFVANGVDPHIKDLLALLPDSDDGWAAIFWCYRHSPRLLGKRAADVFREDPLAVIKAAAKDFCGDSSDW